MIEVECRTCLEMSNLDNSISIARKFLLGKSIRDVILLFAPQMVAAIWLDDIICFTCSKTLYAFAQFIERIVAIERGLKNRNKLIENAKGNPEVEGRFYQNMVVNGESLELYSQCEDTIRLTPRPIQEIKDGPLQPFIDEVTEYSHNQSTSSFQNDPSKKSPIKWVKCRTCLLTMSSLEPSTSLTEKFFMDTTFKEVILHFIPHMVSVPWSDEFICTNCSKTFRDFAEFIERCISIEEICTNIEIGREEVVDGQLSESAIPNTDSQLNSRLPLSPHKSTQDPRKLPNDPNFKSNNAIRTYSRKPKIKEEVVELSDEEESSEPPIFNAMSTNLCEKSARSCQNSPIVTPLVNAVEDYVIEIFGEDEESTIPPDQPIFSTAKDNQEYSYNISAIELSDTDEEIVQLVEKEDHYVTNGASQENSSDDILPCSSTANGSSDNAKPTSVFEDSTDDEQNEASDIDKKFIIIKGDSIYCYPIHPHDRVVSISQPNEVLPTFLEDMSMNDIKIHHYGPPKDMKNKRILLLGSVMVPCPTCKAEFPRNTLKRHMKTKHDTYYLPSLKDGYSSLFMPRKSKLPKSENKILYVFKPQKYTKNTHPCPLCKTVIRTNRHLKRHIKIVHKDFRPYRCEKCGKMFKAKHSYDLHVKKFQNFPSCDGRNCSVCSEMISKKDFASHVRAHQSFVCDRCGFSCMSAFLLKVHGRSHNIQYRNNNRECKQGVKQQKLCPVCGKLTARLAQHMSIHKPRSRKYMCDKCPKSYMSLTCLNVHITTSHHNVKYKCEECNTKCRSVGSLREHIKLKHLKSYVHSCKICGDQFSRGDYFRRHMRIHGENGRNIIRRPHRKYSYISEKSNPVTCKYCLKSFSTVYKLKPHLLTHLKKIRYKCKICGITFSNVGNRHRHEKRHKDPAYELRCKICWNLMKSKEELEKHMEMHEKSKKYRCQYCEEAFARRYLLNNHVFEEHTDKEEVEREKDAVLKAALQEYLLNDD